ncbi:MAG: glycosyltransferase family 9 protein [Kiritimatiellaeota bacterium]|nr:glycosyltransferase family 9 protein [Kiritimatiellota bacterium]
MILANHDSPHILILRGGALGDFILTLPAIRALRRHWPLATIELIGHPGMAELAVAAGLINRVRSLDASGMAQWFVPRRVWPERERADIASFDLVLSYLGDADGVVQVNLRAAGAKRVIACQAIACSPVVASGHAADHFLRPVTDLGISTPISDEPLLVWPTPLREQGRHWLKELGLADNVISLHPGSGSSRKNWPVEQFALLADRVQRSMSAQPVFILGEADAAAAQALPRLAPAVPVLANRTLKEVAAVLAVSRGYVGNDSGITHLAAALGIPIVALFGPTDAAVWGPRGANVVILRGREPTSEALAAIEPETVLRKLDRLIADFKPRY